MTSSVDTRIAVVHRGLAAAAAVITADEARGLLAVITDLEQRLARAESATRFADIMRARASARLAGSEADCTAMLAERSVIRSVLAAGPSQDTGTVAAGVAQGWQLAERRVLDVLDAPASNPAGRDG